MFKNKYYRLIVFTIIMPINGFLMTQNFWFGLLLIMLQLPWAYEWAEA